MGHLDLPIQGDVLIDRQRFPLGVAGDELQLGIRHAGMQIEVRPRDSEQREHLWPSAISESI